MQKKTASAHSVYISNLKFTLDRADIFNLFKPYGHISNINMLRIGKKDKFRGVAFVDMSDLKGAQAAIAALNGSERYGRTLKASLALKQNFKR